MNITSATYGTSQPKIEARWLDCSKCGYQSRTGRRMAGSVSSSAKNCACPRCGHSANVSSEIELDIIQSASLPKPATYQTTSAPTPHRSGVRPSIQRFSTPRSRRPRNRFFTPWATEILVALCVLATALVAFPAVAESLGDAIQHERNSLAETQPLTVRSAGFCDDRINTYRFAGENHPVWSHLKSTCPEHLDAIVAIQSAN